MRLKVDAVDRESGALAPKKLAKLSAALYEQGFAVLEGLVSPETCDLLAGSVREDVKRIRQRDQLTAHERSTAVGHLQLGLRRYGQFVSAEVVANPLLESAVAAVLGDGAWLGFYNSHLRKLRWTQADLVAKATKGVAGEGLLVDAVLGMVALGAPTGSCSSLTLTLPEWSSCHPSEFLSVEWRASPTAARRIRFRTCVRRGARER